MDPGEPRRVYVSTRGQGVLASTDGGQTWQAVGQDVLEGDIASIAVGGIPTMVYAAGKSRGFYRSGDGGRTWEKVGGAVADRGPYALAQDPHLPSTLWLATAGGVFTSSDRGSHWSAAARGLAGAEVVAVLPHPIDPNILYVGTWAGGLYQTTDGGASWQAAPLGTGIVLSLALDPGEPSRVYAGLFYLAGDQETGLYRSSDGGQTWQTTQLQGLTVSAIATSPGKVYLGTDAGPFLSEDNGSTWKAGYVGLPPYNRVSLLALDPRDSSHLYLTLEGSPGDLYQSRDKGQTWAVLYHFRDSLNALAPSPAAAGLLYAATDTAVFRSGDGGESWQEMPFSGEGTVLSLAPHPAVPTTIYLGTTLGAYRSLDGGQTWQWLGLEGQPTAALAISPASPWQVYGGTFGSGLWAYTPVPSLRVEPGQLAFLAEPGGPSPPAAPLALRDESGGAFGWAGQASPSGAWLSLSPSAGVSVPVTTAVSINMAGLAPGAYQGSITLTSTLTGTRNSPWQVPVTLHLGPVQRRYLPWIAQGLVGW